MRWYIEDAPAYVRIDHAWSSARLGQVVAVSILQRPLFYPVENDPEFLGAQERAIGGHAQAIHLRERDLVP